MTWTRPWWLPKRALFVAIALMLGATFLLPLWRTRMEAPQYRGDEALEVAVYAAKVTGDLKEIDTLNQYVGVRLPLEGAEMELLPWVFGTLAVLAGAAALAPARLERRAAAALFVLLLGVGGSGIGVLQYRLYQMGHDRGEQIFERVQDFTPPVLGHIRVANFDSSMSLGGGGWLFLLAVVTAGLMAFLRPGAREMPVDDGGRRAPAPSSTVQERRLT